MMTGAFSRNVSKLVTDNLFLQFFEWEILFYPGLLGVRQYGVHMNGFFYDTDGGVKMWIGRRSPTKPTYPGMLDNTVGK